MNNISTLNISGNAIEQALQTVTGGQSKGWFIGNHDAFADLFLQGMKSDTEGQEGLSSELQQQLKDAICSTPERRLAALKKTLRDAGYMLGETAENFLKTMMDFGKFGKLLENMKNATTQEPYVVKGEAPKKRGKLEALLSAAA